MSANIDSMMYAGQTPWHGLGVAVDKELTAEDAIIKAGLDWTVKKEPVYSKGKKRYKEIPDTFCVVRQDTEKTLGVVGSVYEPLQPKEAFSFFDAIVGEKGAIYHTVGSLGQGEKIWLLAKVSGTDLRIKGTDDIITKFLLLATGFDGKTKTQVGLTPVRVVCQNTLFSALADQKAFFKIKHTQQQTQKIESAREALGFVNKFFVDFEKKANALAKFDMDNEKWKGYLKALDFDPSADKGRALGQVQDLTKLFESGAGQNIKGIARTAWAAYNAVTEYTSHVRPTRVTSSFKSENESRLNSLWFGNSNTLNQEAWNKALALL